MTDTVYDQMKKLTGPELGFIARWLATAYPDAAVQALAALDAYKQQDPDRARDLLGPQIGDSPCS